MNICWRKVWLHFTILFPSPSFLLLPSSPLYCHHPQLVFLLLLPLTPPSSLSSLALPPLPRSRRCPPLWGKAALNGLGAASPCIFNGHARHAGISAWIMHRGWVREREERGGKVAREERERERIWKRRKDEDKRRPGVEDHWVQNKIGTVKKGEREWESVCVIILE